MCYGVTYPRDNNTTLSVKIIIAIIFEHYDPLTDSIRSSSVVSLIDCY